MAAKCGGSGLERGTENGDIRYPGGDEPQAAAGGHEFGDEDAGEQVGDLAGA
jgi:hypothetical protein